MRHGTVGAVLGCCVLIAAVALEAGAPEGRPPQKGPAPNLAGVKAMRDLEYAKPGGKPQLLDLFVPEKADGPLPLIVWIHGGAWLGGSKNGTPAMGQLRRGYAVASINYRLSQEAIFPAQIHDCKAAIRWLRAHAKEYNLDPKRIGVWGSSAGGHLVALVGTSGDVKELEGDEGNLDQSSRVQAVCDWFGPADFCQMAAHALPGSKLDHDAAGSPESKLVGGPIQENKDKVAKANPITYVSKDDPPFLIMHGDKDPLVPHHQSELLNDALKKAGVDVTFKTVEGAGHGFGGPDVMKTVEEFFDKHLKAPAKS
ncbi:MAG: alpha/beta hydrolase [Planctomycetes bacterium]|nr:alpha/beta hydrolase [Planctomycetota bacterium]